MAHQSHDRRPSATQTRPLMRAFRYGVSVTFILFVQYTGGAAGGSGFVSPAAKRITRAVPLRRMAGCMRGLSALARMCSTVPLSVNVTEYSFHVIRAVFSDPPTSRSALLTVVAGEDWATLHCTFLTPGPVTVNANKGCPESYAVSTHPKDTNESLLRVNCISMWPGTALYPPFTNQESSTSP